MHHSEIKYRSDSERFRISHLLTCLQYVLLRCMLIFQVNTQDQSANQQPKQACVHSEASYD